VTISVQAAAVVLSHCRIESNYFSPESECSARHQISIQRYYIFYNIYGCFSNVCELVSLTKWRFYCAYLLQRTQISVRQP